jgi:hypothetical protein
VELPCDGVGPLFQSFEAGLQVVHGGSSSATGIEAVQRLHASASLPTEVMEVLAIFAREHTA